MNLKKWLLVIFSIIIILMIIFIVILTLPKDEKLQENYERQDGAEEITIKYNDIEKLKDRNTFFTVSSCVDKYLVAVYSEEVQTIYDLLSREYISKNKIKIDNLLNKIDNYDEMQIFSADTIYEVNNTENISTYYVEGTIRDDIFGEQNTKETNFYIAVQLDKVNRTYAIIPNEKAPLKNEMPEMQIERIEQKGRNTYTSAYTSESQMASIYLTNYKKLLKNDLNEAYNKLQEEYKQKRFPTQRIFEQYVNSKQDYISELRVKSLSVYTEESGTIIYSVKDQYGDRYIFKETAVMEYTVELDDYTLENEAFKVQYEKVNNRDKGLLNADKFFEMINMQDYEAAYNLLDESFKINNFNTQIDFEKYIKSNVFLFNKVNYEEYNNQISGLHSYKVILTDATEESEKQVSINIVMKLLEGTNFVMSFSID